MGGFPGDLLACCCRLRLMIHQFMLMFNNLLLFEVTTLMPSLALVSNSNVLFFSVMTPESASDSFILIDIILKLNIINYYSIRGRLVHVFTYSVLNVQEET